MSEGDFRHHLWDGAVVVDEGDYSGVVTQVELSIVLQSRCLFHGRPVLFADAALSDWKRSDGREIELLREILGEEVPIFVCVR